MINHGNGRSEVFYKDGDYQAAVNLVEAASERLPMHGLAYCFMPNRFHLVLWPRKDGDLGRWMQWFMTSHGRRYHGANGGAPWSRPAWQA
ncbi:MAG: hypothetical protein GY778_01395 [bacterium]|nr:hypothetical protein [bacterium]